MFGIPEPTSQFTSTNFIELLHSVAQPDTLAASAVKEYSVWNPDLSDGLQFLFH